MIQSFRFVLCVFLLISLATCYGQSNSNQQPADGIKQIIGGGCDGCELMFVGTPDEIHSVDTSAGWKEKGQKLLVTGTVFKRDGTTPAPDVIIYYWQTDNNGLYSPTDGTDQRAKQHGHIRGWVQSDELGKYAFYTIRPAPYPRENTPAHIHIAIKEPDIETEYYVDELVFDDDKFLTGVKRKALENRGGSGILKVTTWNNLQTAQHNIITGLNIPNYPPPKSSQPQSGPQPGEDIPSFLPFHAWGPDKGSTTCPVCKYGAYHGIMYFVGNNPKWNEIKQWLTFLDHESVVRGKYLKVFFVYSSDRNYNYAAREQELERLGAELNIKDVAVTFVPSLFDKESEVHLSRINPFVENTFIIYCNRTVVGKFIDFKPTADNYKKITAVLEKTKGGFFNASGSNH